MPTRQWWPRRNHSAELCWRDLTNARIHLSNGAQSSRSSCIIGMKLSLNTRLLSSLYASKCSKNRHSLLGVSILLRMIREPRGHIFPGSLSTTAPSEQKWHGPNFTIQSCKFNSELEKKLRSNVLLTWKPTLGRSIAGNSNITIIYKRTDINWVQ